MQVDREFLYQLLHGIPSAGATRKFQQSLRRYIVVDKRYIDNHGAAQLQDDDEKVEYRSSCCCNLCGVITVSR